MRLPAVVKLYVLLVSLLAVVVAAAWLAVWPDGWRGAWGPALVLGALTAAALLFPLRLTPSYLLTVDAAPSFAALLLCGPVLAMLVTGLANAVANLLLAAQGKRDRWNVAFNTAQSVLGIGLAGGVLYAFLPLQAPPTLDGGRAVLAVTLAGATLYGFNSLAVATAVGLQHRLNPLALCLQSWRVEAVQSAALLAAGLLTALLAQQHPWAIGAMVLLVVLLYVSLRRTLLLLERERGARIEAEQARAQAERARLEAEQARVEAERARAEAEEAVRMRGEFLSVASHELRTPITSLRGYAQILLRQCARAGELDREKIARGAQVIDQQADKLSRLVAQLLDISRLQAGRLVLERQVVDLAATVREVVAITQGTTSHPLAVQATGPVWALVDPLRMEQVISNLLDNAIRYNQDDGPIEVEVSRLSPETVRLAVRDWGIGILPEDRQRVFERFYQAGGSRFTGGMGLGLYISRQIVEAHGGRIEVEAPPGGGTRFVVTLPAGVREATGAGREVHAA